MGLFFQFGDFDFPWVLHDLTKTWSDPSSWDIGPIVILFDYINAFGQKATEDAC